MKEDFIGTRYYKPWAERSIAREYVSHRGYPTSDLHPKSSDELGDGWVYEENHFGNPEDMSDDWTTWKKLKYTEEEIQAWVNKIMNFLWLRK